MLGTEMDNRITTVCIRARMNERMNENSFGIQDEVPLVGERRKEECNKFFLRGNLFMMASKPRLVISIHHHYHHHIASATK